MLSEGTGMPNKSISGSTISIALFLNSDQLQHELPCWIGGHFTVPYEQNTQQSPCLGFNKVLQFSHS
jgi:hypothetical protein